MKRTLAVLATTLLLAVAGCSSSDGEPETSDTVPPTTAAPAPTAPPGPPWAEAPVNPDTARAAMEGDRPKAMASLGSDERGEVKVEAGKITVSYLYEGFDAQSYTQRASSTVWTDAGILFTNPGVTAVEVDILSELTDELGNKTTEPVATLTFDRATYDAANWPGLEDRISTNLTYMFCVADEQFIHAALSDAKDAMDCR